MDCRTALLTVLDQVDYTAGNCRQTEMVGACLAKEVIALAREAIAEADRQIAIGLEIARQVYEQEVIQHPSQPTTTAAQPCGNCGVSRAVLEHSILEKCPNCGDDEIDLSGERSYP